MRFLKILIALFIISGICFSSTSTISNPVLFHESRHTINVWEKDTTVLGGNIIMTGNDDSLFIDSIYFSLNKSYAFVNQLTFVAFGEDPSRFIGDSINRISFPNSNYGAPGGNRKIILLPSDFAYMFNFNFSFTQAHAGDTLTVLLYFKFSRHYQDSVVRGVDSLIIRKIAETTRIFKSLSRVSLQFQALAKNRFDLLGRRINFSDNSKALRQGLGMVIINSNGPKKSIAFGKQKTNFINGN